MPLRTILFCLVLLIAFGCNPSKVILEEAQKLESAGLHLEALEKYAALYQSDPSNIDAQIGAKKEAGFILNQKAAHAKTLLASGQFDASLNLLNEVDDLLFTYQWLNLEKPMLLDMTRAEAKQAKGEWLYTSAQTAVLNEQYESAATYLSQLDRVRPGMQEAQYLRLMMEIVPNYKKGVKAMELGLYREAHGYFKAVTDVDTDYKDALQRLKDCQEKAAFTIAFVAKPSSDGHDQVESTLAAEIKKSVVQLQDPLIRLVDRDHLEEIIAEQQQMMEAGFSEASAVEAGKLLGAEYVIIGELVNYKETTGRRSAFERKGWLGAHIRSPKVKYMEYRQKRTLEGGFRYQLMNAETGEVIAAGNIPFCVDDEVHFARFDGNRELLHKGFWKFQLIGSSQDYVEYDTESKDEIDALLNGRDQLKSMVDLQFELSRDVAERISQEINSFAATR